MEFTQSNSYLLDIEFKYEVKKKSIKDNERVKQRYTAQIDG